MKDLSVYFCPDCGRYGYFQPKNSIICTNCTCEMKPLGISCSDFMELSSQKRDILILEKIMTESRIPSHTSRYRPGISNKNCCLAKSCCRRHMFFSMDEHLQELQRENQQLIHTIDWMHQTIWQLLSENKKLEKCLKEII